MRTSQGRHESHQAGHMIAMVPMYKVGRFHTLHIYTTGIPLDSLFSY